MKREEVHFSLRDLFNLLKKQKGRITFFTLVFALIAFGYSVTRPVKYFSEASFNDKQHVSVGDSNILSFFQGALGGVTQKQQGLDLLKSRRIIERAVIENGTQALIQKKQIRFPLIKCMWENICTSWALFRNQTTPALPGKERLFEVRELIYDGEVPLTLQLTFLYEEGEFEIYRSGILLDKGKIGHPVVNENFRFTLFKIKEDPLSSQTYLITLRPRQKVVKELENRLEVKASKMSKGLITLRYWDRDRHNSRLLLNQLMEAYRSYLKEEQMRISTEQLDFLNIRQKKADNNLKEKLYAYADSVVEDISSTGTIDTPQAMGFLVAKQQAYREKLIEIDLILKRLATAAEDKTCCDNIFLQERFPALATALEGRQHLKTRYDALLLSLPQHGQRAKPQHLDSLMAELDLLDRSSKEIERLQVALKRGVVAELRDELPEEREHLIVLWQEKLSNAEPQKRPALKKEYDHYLAQVLHSCKLQEKELKEALKHLNGVPISLQGIDLAVADQLSAGYQVKLNELEAEIAQLHFLIDQLEAENVELSALSALVIDPVSREIVLKAGKLAVELQDEQNRSLKEQQRIEEALHAERRFFVAHLQHTLALLELRKTMVEEKLFALQQLILKLIEQRISVVETEVRDYLMHAENNLREEKALIEQQKKKLNNELATLPKKWIAEKLINYNLQLNETLSEEIVKLAESKNLSSHLEVIKSIPVDKATLPLHPQSPNLLLFTILGALFGFFSSAAYSVSSTFLKGFAATAENISLAGAHVSGLLSGKVPFSKNTPLLDEDLESLRRLLLFFGERLEKEPLLWIEGIAPDYAPMLTELLAKQGVNPLLISLNQDQDSEGLIPFLEGKCEAPTHEEQEGYHLIKGGGVTRFSNELFSSKKFKTFLKEQMQRYDRIIVATPALPTTAEAENLAQLFKCIALTVQEETLPELDPYLSLQEKQLTFLFYKGDN